MTTVVSIMMSDIVPLRERGVWQGYINLIFASGAASGAPLGGLLSDSLGWRWVFIIQLPMCVIAIIGVALLLNLPKQEHSHWRSKLQRVDFLGALVLVAAVSTLLVGLDRGSNVSWSAVETLVPLCVSFPLMAAFALVEMKVASEPFAPGHIIFNRSLFAAFLCNFFSFGAVLGVLFFLPLFFQAVNGENATIAGAKLIPATVSGVSGSLFAGFLMKRSGRYYWLTVIAYTCLTIGILVNVLFTGVIVKSTVGILIGLAFQAFNNGVGVTSSLIAISKPSISVFYLKINKSLS